MKTKTLRQSVMFKAKPGDVYEALMDSKKHAKFTNAKASISRKIGGKVHAYNSYVEATNLELVKNKKIVQSWHSVRWPAEHFSRASFSLSPVKGGTRLSLYHSGIPAEHFESIRRGWKEQYWVPLKKMIEK